jgi:uncharacterized membrane protein
VNDRSVHPSVHSRRVIFIDLARALAVVLMVAGHTSSALLHSDYRSGPWFDAWNFQRGLTSALFLLLAGFAFSVATTRHWTTHVALSAAFFKRVRRFALFVLLGYSLHFPVPHYSELPGTTPAQWQSFVAVDVLQLIGVTLIAIQVLVLVTQTRRVFMLASFLVAAIVIAVSPTMWRTDWTALVPLPIAAYLSPATGSLFPLFPWAAYVFVGAGAGQIYARWGAANLLSFASWGMLLPGAALIAAGLALSSQIPSDVALRTGVCFLVLSLTAIVSRHISQLPHVFGAVAQESLVVYFVHLCIVYGSIWNPGLARFYGMSLSLPATILMVVAVVLAMIGLAWQWNRFKHVRPQTARWVTATVAVLLVSRLL